MEPTVHKSTDGLVMSSNLEEFESESVVGIIIAPLSSMKKLLNSGDSCEGNGAANSNTDKTEIADSYRNTSAAEMDYTKRGRSPPPLLSSPSQKHSQSSCNGGVGRIVQRGDLASDSDSDNDFTTPHSSQMKSAVCEGRYSPEETSMKLLLESSDDDDDGGGGPGIDSSAAVTQGSGVKKVRAPKMKKKSRRIPLNVEDDDDSDSDDEIPTQLPFPRIESLDDGHVMMKHDDKFILESSDCDDVASMTFSPLTKITMKTKSSKKQRRVVNGSDSDDETDHPEEDDGNSQKMKDESDRRSYKNTKHLSSSDNDEVLPDEIEGNNEELDEVLKSNKSSKPRKERKSKKAAMEEIQFIHSESQRLIRESALNIPYHKPKKMSLNDFLNSRKNKRNGLLLASVGGMKQRLPPRILHQQNDSSQRSVVSGQHDGHSLESAGDVPDKPDSQESLTMETDELTLTDRLKLSETIRESQSENKTQSQGTCPGNLTSGYGSNPSPSPHSLSEKSSQLKRSNKYKSLLDNLPPLKPTLKKFDEGDGDCIDFSNFSGKSKPVNIEFEKFRKRFFKHADMTKKPNETDDKTKEGQTAEVKVQHHGDQLGVGSSGSVVQGTRGAWGKYKQMLQRDINAQKQLRWLKKKQEADLDNEAIMDDDADEEEEEMSESEDESADDDKNEEIYDEGTMSSRTGTDDSAFKTPARPFKPIATGTPLPAGGTTRGSNNTPSSCRTLDVFDSNSEQTGDSMMSRSTDGGGGGGSYSLRGLFNNKPDNNSSSSRHHLDHHNSSDMFTNGSLDQETDVSNTTTWKLTKNNTNDDDSSFEMIGSVISAYQPGGGMRGQSEEGSSVFTPFSRLRSSTSDKLGTVVDKGSVSDFTNIALPIENSQWFYGDSTQDTLVSPPPIGSLGFRFPINDESQSQLLDSNGLLNLSCEDKPSQKETDHELADGSQTNIDELLGLCSGKFITQKPSSEGGGKLAISEILSSQLVSSQDNMDELFGLCSGKWGEKPADDVAAVLEKFEEDEENSMSLKLESDDDGLSDDQVHDADDESETEIGKKNKRKRKHKARVSDDDDDEDDDEYDEEEERNSVYEEELAIISKEKRRRLADYIEGEAQLSGSDFGSGDDEDNSDLDKMDPELITENLPSEEEMRSQIERFHVKKLMDEDASEIRLYKEMLLEDGDLHGDGKTRQRQFRWRNTGDDDPLSVINDDADGSGDNNDIDESKPGTMTTTPDDWRKVRHERELWLEEQKNQNRETDNPIHETNPALKFSKPNFRQKKVELVVPATSKQISPLRQQNANVKQTVLHRGSFLTRNKGTLFKLAENIRPAASNATSAVTSARGFVFKTVSPRHVPEKKLKNLPVKSAQDTPTRKIQKPKSRPLNKPLARANSKLFQHLEVPP